MLYRWEDLPRTINSRIWSAVVAPRPVFLIVSHSEEHVSNIAAYSSISLISTFPPMISMSFGRRNGKIKNTLANIQATGEFSVNVVPRTLAFAANESAAGDEILDDFSRLSLKPRPFGFSRALAIAESPASIACELVKQIEVEDTSCTLILARCKELLVDEPSQTGDLFDPVIANVIASVGAEEYISVSGEPFTMGRTWE